MVLESELSLLEGLGRIQEAGWAEHRTRGGVPAAPLPGGREFCSLKGEQRPAGFLVRVVRGPAHHVLVTQGSHFLPVPSFIQTAGVTK